ncbi:MAG: GNAT family N-acetyltransferase, partial [Woeseia sp.]
MGDANIIIRRANKSDAGTIAQLIAQLAQATGQSSKMTSTEADFARFGFGAVPAFNVLLAEVSGNAVGLSLWFYNFSSWRGELGAYLQDLYVDDSQRGTGLGRRL